ncbi:Golgi resident protein GCP60 [Chionoecetes opilio]|uniref:Golgi resident protein GCP60 n=1 Tax=Chionoecetes opilio TaxID=41210 RepID=A0A8J4Y7A1_CHIOP|nr:Golgi resident protein GCP60 [Chionoecetes opilio]
MYPLVWRLTKQAVLIRQLQDQHYQQYMQQVYQQQLLLQQQQQQQAQDRQENHLQDADGVNGQGGPDSHTDGGDESPVPAENGRDSEEEGDSEEDEEDDTCQNVAPASMWTRRDIQDFKESIKNEGGDSVIKVGHGETVTVRVPTHEDGTCLFWEFATDSYDIGFGVYFEWTKDSSNVVSVHISESEDEEEEEEPEGVIFAESLEVLVMALEALHEEAKPLGLEVSWLKTKVQVFGDLLDKTVQSVHACGKDIEIL